LPSIGCPSSSRQRLYSTRGHTCQRFFLLFFRFFLLAIIKPSVYADLRSHWLKFDKR
jgi:hypothetical protein